MDHASPHFDHAMGAVEITTPDLHLRGMDRNKVVIDGTKPGSPQCSSAPADQDFGVTDPNGHAAGRNGVLVWKADRVWVENLTACNFLNGARRHRQRDLVGRRQRQRPDRADRLLGQLPQRDLDLLRRREHRRRVRHLLLGLDGAGHVQADLRQQLQRLGHVRGRLPAGLQRADRPRLDAVQRARLLGHELGRRDRGPELGVRPQPGRLRHQLADRRRPARSPGRRLPERRASARSPTRNSCWVFQHNYVHDNNNADTPSSGSAAQGPVRHRDDHLGWTQQHGHEQRLRQQRRLGRAVRPLPGRRLAVARPDLRRQGRHPDLRPGLRVRLVGQRAARQHVQRTTASTGTRATGTSGRSP